MQPTETTSDPYVAIRAKSERVSWTVDQVLGARPVLDLTRPLLPEAMTRSAELDFLSPREQLLAGHLRGYAYARISGAFEEGILPFVLGRLRDRPAATRDEIRALFRFADEELKHMQLFDRYARAFEAQTGVAPHIVFTREMAIAGSERSHPLSAALITMHVEWMTQTHYLQAIKNDTDLDRTSLRMLTYHYIEEVQHARIDELLIDAIASTCSADEIAGAVDAYRVTCSRIDQLLQRQAEHDADAFAALSGRTLRADERARFVEHQHVAARECMLGAGERHPRVRAALDALQAQAA